MKCIILAAGQGIRMEPLSLTTPKCLMPLVGKPLFIRQLYELQSVANEIIIVHNDASLELIKEEISKRAAFIFAEIKRIDYIKQIRPMGTAQAIKLCRNYIDAGEAFIVLNGDNFYCRDDLRSLVKNDRAVLTGMVNNPSQFGLVECFPSMPYIHKIIEKPHIDTSDDYLVNAGAYKFQDDIFEKIRDDSGINEAINRHIRDSSVQYQAVGVNGQWIRFDYPWDLPIGNRIFFDLLKSRSFQSGQIKEFFSSSPDSTCKISDMVLIGSKTIIHPNVVIDGPVRIGDNCVIGPNCYIRDYTVIGNHCRVGNGCEIKGSILMDGAKVPHLSYVGDSVIGSNANLGAGTIVANLRHDKSNVRSEVGAELIDTGLQKLGAIIGADAKIGIGTRILPGRKIWPGQTTLPNEVVGRDKK